MNLSANVLFHYTNSFENIIGILKNGFEHRPVEEDLSITGFKNSPFSIPGVVRYKFTWKVVCFCDIPFRNIHHHINQYGSYCLGLNKEWGITSGVTPVRYIHYYTPDIQDGTFLLSLSMRNDMLQQDKHITEILADILTENGEIDSFSPEDFDRLPIEAKKIIAQFEAEMKEIVNNVYSSGGYLKSYKGPWKDRETGKLSERIFYDENEWRSLLREDSNPNLNFRLMDIKSIFVKTSDERETIVSTIIKNEIFMDGQTENDLRQKIYLIQELKDLV